MHLRSTRVPLRPENIDDVLGITTSSVLPSIRGDRGYAGWMSLVDRASGKFVSLCLWDCEDDIRVNEASGFYAEYTSMLAQFAVAPHIRETFEVAIFDTPAPGVTSMRATTFSLIPSRIPEALLQTETSFLPLIKRDIGYGGWLSLANRETGKYISLCLWDRPEHIDANERGGFYRDYTLALADLSTAPHVREVYEIAIVDVAVPVF